jgi:prolyl oligopeptidase
MNTFTLLSATLATVAINLPAFAAGQAYPPAPQKPVTNTYHGVSVTDSYQWLENADDPEVKAWVAAENKLSRTYLDAFPARQVIADHVKTLFTSASNDYYAMIERGGKLFALKRQPPKQQPLLVTLTSADDLASEKIVLDPNTLVADGSVTIDFFQPSLDGKWVAVSLSEKGSEDGSLHFFDAATGKEQGDVIPRVGFPTGGGSVDWSADGKGVYYTRYPAPGERSDADIHFYQQVYFHAIGAPVANDHYEIGKDFPRIAEVQLSVSPDGKYTLARVANGDGGDFAFYLKAGRNKTAWHRIADFADSVKHAEFGQDGYLYLLSRQDAPRGKLLRLPLAKPELKHAAALMLEDEGAVQQYEVAGGKVFVAELVGGPSQLKVIDIATKKVTQVKLPGVNGVADLVHAGKGMVLARITSYLIPTSWYHVTAAGDTKQTALVTTSAADYSDAEVVRVFAPSKDGTKVPLNIIRRKGAVLDGNNPLLLTAYGGYGVNLTPGFALTPRIWLDQGGIYVIANLRGGGEYGDAWHKAGNLTKKQNVFDDFIASAEYLIANKYTSPQHLAIQGGSNGGLLMGAVFTQRPDLFRAVISAVGIYDMLRVELDPNGAFNVTEFGTVKDKPQFEALYAYSPFHHVKDGTDYPAILMTTGDHDGRVNPAHSRKMIARLQAADLNGRPILLRTSSTSGHGIGTALSDRIYEITDGLCFMFQELSVTVKQP